MQVLESKRSYIQQYFPLIYGETVHVLDKNFLVRHTSRNRYLCNAFCNTKENVMEETVWSSIFLRSNRLLFYIDHLIALPL